MSREEGALEVAEQSPEATLAVAINDIEWIKDTMRDTNQGIKDLQRTFSEQSQSYATKDDVQDLRKDMDRLKVWRAWLTGTLGAALFIGVLGFEYLRQWIGGGNH